MTIDQRAKRRSPAQKIGKAGELLFAGWAVAGHLTANKLEDDFGVDYLCQLMKPVSSGADEVTGKSAFVQVRATTGGDKPRVGMDRVDAETALRHDGVFALAAAHLPSKDVYFRWLDVAFMQELIEFLNSDRETITFRLDTMSQGVDKFARELHERSRYGQRAKFERARVRLGLVAAIPGAKLSLSVSDTDEDWVEVTVPNVLSVVKGGTEAHEALAGIMFRPVDFAAGFQEVLAQYTLHHAVLAAGELLVDGTFVISGGAEAEVTLTIESGEEKASSSFLLRQVQDELAYIGSSGLVLRITAARLDEQSGERRHKVGWRCSDQGSVDLIESGQLDFLKLMRPGAHLFFDDKHSIPLDEIGMTKLGHSIEILEAFYTALELPMTGVRLIDLSNDVFGRNLGVMAALTTPGDPLVEGLMGVDESDIPADAWTRCQYRLPVTLRLKEHPVLALVPGECEIFLDEAGAARAIKFLTREAAGFDKSDYAVQGDGRAEVHLGFGIKPYILATATPDHAKAVKNVPFQPQYGRLPAFANDPTRAGKACKTQRS